MCTRVCVRVLTLSCELLSYFRICMILIYVVQTWCKLKELLDKVEELETTNDVLKQRLVS